MIATIRKMKAFLADDAGSVPIEYALLLAPTAGMVLLGWLRTIAGMANAVSADPT